MLRFRPPAINLMGLLSLLGCLYSGPTYASTVLEMSFVQVVEQSELVFEGQVLSTQSRRMNDGSIHTFVIFEIIDLVKGDYRTSQIELSFLGGEIAGSAMHVTDMQIPLVGETGVYFVESLRQPQVNPFVGWAQGHYLIDTMGNGERVVTTPAHEMVISLDASATQAPISSAMNSFSKGKAKGVETKNQTLVSPLSQAISADEFKAVVRNLVAQTQ